MKLILRYLKQYRELFIVNIISAFGLTLVELGIPTIIADMVDVGIMSADTDCIIRMEFAVLLISLIGVSMTIFLGYCCTKVSTAITGDIRNNILDCIQRFIAYELNRFGIPSMTTRTNNDALQIQMFVNVLLRTVSMVLITFVASIIMIAGVSLPLSGIIVVTIPLIIIGVFVTAKVSKPISENQQTSLDSLNRISRENLSGVRVIHVFGNDAYEQQCSGDTSKKSTGYSRKLFKLMMMTSPIFFLLINVAGLCIYWVAALLIQGDDLPLGQLVALMDYLFHATFFIALFCTIFMMYSRAKVNTKRIKAVFDTVPLVHNDRKRMDRDQQGTISFEHVAFICPDGKEPVSKDVNFFMKRGEAIAFVGSTGSGRSTLISLIPRFCDVSEGSIRIDGVDVYDYDLFELRSRLGTIPQKAFLLNGTIADDIRSGKPDAAMEEIMQAAKTAQVCGFIMEKGHGFEEEITEGATNVFGGQKQRLSIVQALVHKPNIYVFDDFFSALDFGTDAVLRKELKRETGDTTVTVVAQRISNTMGTDHIIVLNRGNVIGTGTHRELLRDCEVYKEIALSQLSEEELTHR